MIRAPITRSTRSTNKAGRKFKMSSVSDHTPELGASTVANMPLSTGLLTFSRLRLLLDRLPPPVRFELHGGPEFCRKLADSVKAVSSSFGILSLSKLSIPIFEYSHWLGALSDKGVLIQFTPPRNSREIALILWHYADRINCAE